MILAKEVRKLRDLIGRHGPGRAMLAAFMKSVAPCFMISQVRVLRNKAYDGGSTLPPEFEIRAPTRMELASAVREMPDALSVGFIDTALARGDICTAAFKDGSVVAFLWTAFQTAQTHSRLRVHIQAPYHYGYKAYTRPDYRGLRLIQHVIRSNCERCLSRGYTHSIVYIEPTNYASMANSDRLGSRCIGRAGYVRLFGIGRTFRTLGVKKHGFRFELVDPPS